MAAAKDEAAKLAGKQAAELDAERSRTAALTDELSSLRENSAIHSDTDEERVRRQGSACSGRQARR